MTAPSVLTIVRDREPHLIQLVEGLRRSSEPPGELVIVDMSARPVATPVADFPVRVVRLAGDGLPLAAARNRAAAAATGEHFVFLDVDCIPMRGSVARLAAVLAETDALCCADVRYLGPDDARDAWDEPALLAAGTQHPARPFPSAGVAPQDNPGLFWSLAFAIRRESFQRIGGFDERFVGYGGEDTDFGYRAVAAGLPLLFVGGALACHQWHPNEDPPVRHLADIVRNAACFHSIHGWWPMEGWLRAFAEMGLIRWSDGSIALVDQPRREAKNVRSSATASASPIPEKISGR